MLKYTKLCVVTVAMGIGSVAMAQNANTPNRQAAPESKSGTSQQPPQTAGQSFAGALRKSGGSLAQASQAMGTDSTPVTSFSFYAVPKPEPKTLKKHDLITIVVREESAFTSVGDMDLQRHSDFDAQIDAYMQLHFSPSLKLGTQIPATPLETKATHDRNEKGTATVDRTDTMTARITAEVVDVKPNGNLVLQATKKIKTDDEEQQITLIGTCRAEDLTADNTVLSNQLSSLEVTKTHKGAVHDTTERGFLTKLLDSINPF